jgi:SET domain-containing protein 6
VRSKLSEELNVTEDDLTSIVLHQLRATKNNKLTQTQEAQFEEDELEEYFIIERDSGEPSSEGRLTHPAKLQEVSPELDEQFKTFLKALKKAKPEVMSDKRKRDEIYTTVMGNVLTAKLAQYPTTVEEDEALLKKSDIAKRHRMAIEVRLGEKRLVQEAIALVQGEEEPVASNGGKGGKKTKREA